MKFAMLILATTFFGGCETERDSRNEAGSIASDCERTLVSVRHMNGWCVAACKDTIHVMRPAPWYVMLVPCEAVEKRIER